MSWRNLTHRRVICAKGLLFALGGALASALLLIDSPSFKTAGLLAIAVWCFARFYYFAFYVMQKYVDPEYRFAGLWSAVWFLASRTRAARRESHE